MRYVGSRNGALSCFVSRKDMVIIMTETVIALFAMVLCAVGAVGIIRFVALKLSVSGDKNDRIYAVILRDEPDIRLQMLKSTLEWDTALKDVRVLAVDGGLDTEAAEYCRAICEKNGITYVSAEAAEILNGLL